MSAKAPPYRDPAPTPGPPAPSLLSRALRHPVLGTLLIALLDAAASLLLSLVHPVLAVLGSVALGLALLLRYGPDMEDMTRWFSGFLLVVSFALLLPLGGASSVLFYLPAHDVAVARLSEPRFATALYLRDPVVRGELRGSNPNRSRGGAVLSYTYAWPLVDARWTREQPVHAWVLCESYRCRDGAPPAGTLAMPAAYRVADGGRFAANNARLRHDLSGVGDAPLFDLYASWGQALWARTETTLAASSIFGFFWLLALARNAWKRRAR